MQTSEKIDKLMQSLADVQAKLKPVHKSAQGHGYNYAPLDAVIESARPLLAEHGIVVLQMPTTPSHMGFVALTTRIALADQWIESTAEMPIPEPVMSKSGKPTTNEAQRYGSGLTYLRRYMFAAGLGILDTEDIDAATPNNRPSSNGAVTAGQLQKRQKQMDTLGKEVYGPDWPEKFKEFCAHLGVESADDMTLEQMDKIMAGMTKKLEAA